MSRARFALRQCTHVRLGKNDEEEDSDCNLHALRENTAGNVVRGEHVRPQQQGEPPKQTVNNHPPVKDGMRWYLGAGRRRRSRRKLVLREGGLALLVFYSGAYFRLFQSRNPVHTCEHKAFRTSPNTTEAELGGGRTAWLAAISAAYLAAASSGSAQSGTLCTFSVGMPICQDRRSVLITALPAHESYYTHDAVLLLVWSGSSGSAQSGTLCTFSVGDVLRRGAHLQQRSQCANHSLFLLTKGTTRCILHATPTPYVARPTPLHSLAPLLHRGLDSQNESRNVVPQRVTLTKRVPQRVTLAAFLPGS